MKGLLAAVTGGLSKGVGQVASTQMEVNARKALLEAEEEMRARLAEAAEGRAETRAIAAEQRAISNISEIASATAAAEESVLASRFAEGSSYPGLLASRMEAEQRPGERAAAELTAEQAEFTKKVNNLRSTLAETENEAERNKLIRQMGDLVGAFGASAKTLTDVVAAGNGYRSMADSLDSTADRVERSLADIYDDEERRTLRAQILQKRQEADAYRREADIIFKTAFETRAPGAASSSPQAGTPPADRRPLSDFKL
jgi:hypothetical protein